MDEPHSIAKLAAALAKAQAQMHGAKKDSQNPHLNSKYADLASCWEACRDPLTSNGLSIIQLLEGKAPEVSLRTILAHESGEYIEGVISATAKDGNPQTIGSLQTYLRRYGLMAIVGIAPEDDDAESAQPVRQFPAHAPKAAMDAPKVELSTEQEMVTKSQIIELVSHCERVFGDSPEARLRAIEAISQQIGREIVSRKALTRTEAVKIIAKLAKTRDGKYMVA